MNIVRELYLAHDLGVMAPAADDLGLRGKAHRAVNGLIVADWMGADLEELRYGLVSDDRTTVVTAIVRAAAMNRGGKIDRALRSLMRLRRSLSLPKWPFESWQETALRLRHVDDEDLIPAEKYHMEPCAYGASFGVQSGRRR
jgi:hypothetical protein